jgi:hypothetical protein
VFTSTDPATESVQLVQFFEPSAGDNVSWPDFSSYCLAPPDGYGLGSPLVFGDNCIPYFNFTSRFAAGDMYASFKSASLGVVSVSNQNNKAYNFKMSWFMNDDYKSGMRFLAWSNWQEFEDHAINGVDNSALYNSTNWVFGTGVPFVFPYNLYNWYFEVPMSKCSQAREFVESALKLWRPSANLYFPDLYPDLNSWPDARVYCRHPYSTDSRRFV